MIDREHLISLAKNNLKTEQDGTLKRGSIRGTVTAILTELRIPSESMSLAGKAAYATIPYPDGLDAAFTAMIDHVLTGSATRDC